MFSFSDSTCTKIKLNFVNLKFSLVFEFKHFKNNSYWLNAYFEKELNVLNLKYLQLEPKKHFIIFLPGENHCRDFQSVPRSRKKYTFILFYCIVL